MPNLELYLTRYCVLKNLDTFAKLISNLAFIFESHSLREESMSHSLTKRWSWKQRGTTTRPRRREELIEGWTLLVRRV